MLSVLHISFSPNDSSCLICCPFPLMLVALGWHFYGAVPCKSRVLLLCSLLWLGVVISDEVRTSFPTCIFGIYLCWISPAISYVISFHKVLLQFLTVSLCPRYCGKISSKPPPCASQGSVAERRPLIWPDGLSVLQVCASPWVSWYSVLRWYMRYAVKWICMCPLCSSRLVYEKPEQALGKQLLTMFNSQGVCEFASVRCCRNPG